MNKPFRLFLAASLLTVLLTGCNQLEDKDAAIHTEDIHAYNAADANPASDFQYAVGEDGGITITQYIGADPSIVIPEKIEGKPVTVIGTGAFGQNPTVESVSMPDSVTQIEVCAFSECTALTTVRLSNRLESIDEYAFFSCKTLSDIALPDSLTYLGPSAFSLCESLKHITLPPHCFDTLDPSEVGYCYGSFSDSGLESVELKDGLSVIPAYTFAHTNLKEVVIPGSVKKIDYNAFAGCSELKKVTLNEGIVSLQHEIFDRTSITEIVIPKTVAEVHSSTFDGASMLEKVYFQGDAPALYMLHIGSDDQANYTVYFQPEAKGFSAPKWYRFASEMSGQDLKIKRYLGLEYYENADGTLTICGYSGKDGTVVIPETISGSTVTEIGAFAFYDNAAVASVTIPDSVVSIGEQAFTNCYNLMEVHLPKTSLQEIGRYAFYRCRALTQIEIPESLEVLSEFLFAASGLNSITLPEGLKVIEADALAATMIEEIVIPNSVNEIKEFAFSNCSWLKSVLLADGISSIEAGVFWRCTDLQEIVIPASIEKIASNAFAFCDQLISIQFEGNAPDGLRLSDLTDDVYVSYHPAFTVYYREGAEGFTSPEWNGYPAEIWK